MALVFRCANDGWASESLKHDRVSVFMDAGDENVALPIQTVFKDPHTGHITIRVGLPPQLDP